MCVKYFDCFEDRKDTIFENMLHEVCDTKAAFQGSFKLRQLLMGLDDMAPEIQLIKTESSK